MKKYFVIFFIFIFFINAHAEKFNSIYIEEIKGQFISKIIARIKDKNPAEVSIYLKYEQLKLDDLEEIADFAHTYAQTYCDIDFDTKNDLKKIEAAKNKKEKEKIKLQIKHKNNRLVNDNEVDALRHFIVSGLMAGRYSYGIARQFMTAHEHSEKISAREAMDLYNNELGLLEGGRLFESNKSVKELADKLFEIAFMYLHSGRLSVITDDEKLSLNCRIPEHYPNSRHKTIKVDSFFRIKNGLPASCLPIKKSICKNRKTSHSQAFCIYRRDPSASFACKEKLADMFSL